MMQNHLVARLIEAGVDERITGAIGRFVDQVTAHGVPEERDRTFLVLVSEQLLAQVKAGRLFKAAVTCLLGEINAARTLLGIELSHYQHPVSRRAFFMLA